MKEFLTKTLDDKDVLQNNEIQANKLVGFTMFLSSFVIGVVLILSKVGVFLIRTDSILIGSIFELIIPAIICQMAKARKAWLKYILVIELMIVLARIDSILGYNVVLIMVLPVILSCRYFSKKFTKMISVLTAILFALSAFAGSWLNVRYFDLNFYDVPKGSVINVDTNLKSAVKELGINRNIRIEQEMLLNYLPKLFIFIVIAIVCIRIAEKGRSMVLEQKLSIQKTARIESELNLAKSIQAHMLPMIFPPFPEREEFDIYALMEPAKEVGGDFYDFFMLDDNNIAIVIADVSGKGIPAALFMAIAKTLIKNEAGMGLEPAEIFTTVNHMLCEGNDNDMFVTAWLGILNIENGKLTYVNAGHNPPLLKSKGDKFEFLKSRPGFVLAGMDGLKYRQYETELEPGDKLLLYTDGVTEAENEKKELYGNERLINYLNSHIEENIKDTLVDLRKDISEFAGDEEQFDDITMLMLYYQKQKHKSGGDIMKKRFKADNNELPAVISFLEDEITRCGCQTRDIMRISLCVEEIFVNIAQYAYVDKDGEVVIEISQNDKDLVISFEDSGKPFNPLDNKEPDITANAEERPIGGLGIHIVKEMMDEVKYEYINEKNILTIKKKMKNYKISV